MEHGKPTNQLGMLVALLRAHRPSDAHEAAMTEDTIRFVEHFPDCLLRTQLRGHITGSAWIVDSTRTLTLFTHHRKLDKWLQLGGHADGDGDILAVALREAREESGLTSVRAVSPAIFDVDRHWIPERKSEPSHWHYDVRFMLEADPTEPLVVTSESKDLAWVNLSDATKLNAEESIARMVRKTLGAKSEDQNSKSERSPNFQSSNPSRAH